MVAQLPWSDEQEGGDQGQGDEEEGDDAEGGNQEEEEEEPVGGVFVYGCSLPPELAATALTRLRFYNCLFDTFPEASHQK